MFRQQVGTAAYIRASDQRRRVRYGTAIVPYRRPKRVFELVHVVGDGVWLNRACVVCETFYTSRWPSVTCSEECMAIRNRGRRRLAKDRRRVRKREAFREDVYRAKVFAADGYRCHLCGLMTDRSKVVPHPKAPTIDHVIPLAEGGTHEPSNCRTAHFLCNSIKGDRGGGEQMLLLTV